MVDKQENLSLANLTNIKPIISDDEWKHITKFLEFLATKKIQFDKEKNDESVLIRFLRARKYDINKTFEMFKNYLEWRETKKVDEIFSYDFPEFSTIKKNYPMGFHKTDKFGRPIYFEITGNMNLEEIFKASSIERMIKHQIRQFEYVTNFMLPACTKKFGRHISQTLNIMDLRKQTSKFMSKKVLNFVKSLLEISQNYYPEILGNLFVINTGMTFKILWTAVKPFMDEKTKNKITPLGSDYKKKLLEYIDEENLPEILGGKSKYDPHGYINEGPWVDYEDEKTKQIKYSERADLIYAFNSNSNIENNEGILNVNDYNEKNEDIGLSNNFNEDPLDDVDENMDKMLKNEIEDDDDEENRKNIEALSDQLKFSMPKMNNKNEFDNKFFDGETPINTQEVFFIFLFFNFFSLIG